MIENYDSRPAGDIASRIAARTLADREAVYAGEVRRLLDAALELIRTAGTGARPRVADIVAAAGLSNDAFYRHFPSKDALIAVLIEDGADRLVSYVAHRMDKQDTPRDAVRAWVEGVLSQAADETATTTRAVLWNAGALTPAIDAGSPLPGGRLALLLHRPFTELGSVAPEFDAGLIAHATVGRLSDYLWRREEPTAADVDRVTAFCLRALTIRQDSAGR
ncbi:TetR/AcrR family transcriptional regulator [Nocardia jiangxiensis]|uniref:TetR/AcrR family transcriptional regulator n=1 Tax=Nocardia jiangxiensis TaxID=282685 RepID=UPI00031D6562|nr:TetR/AcrR family transcriptional regulator [Nocardia jiangxiensis]